MKDRMIMKDRMNLAVVQYGQQVVAALKLAANGRADFILEFLLLFNILFPSDQCVKVQKT